MASATDEVVIKKEIEDTPESPEQVDNQDSAQNQTEPSSGKATKVWLEEETRSLIALAKHYIPKFKDSNYTKRQLLEDISNELHMIGCDATLDHVRNKLKYLRAKYKSTNDYNAKHVVKRTMPFSEELADLYSLDYFGDQDQLHTSELNGSSDRFNSSNNKTQKKASKSVPASHVDLGTVVTTKKRTLSQKSSRSPAKKKTTAKSKGSQPLFQCGLCMQKFSTSHDMHGHNCKNIGRVAESNKKKMNSNSPGTSSVLTLWLKPTGNAPILKNKKWTVEKNCTVAKIINFLKQIMKLDASASVFLYVNQSFSPSPDHEVGNVYECFNINGKLVLHYSTSPAWG